MPTKLDEISAAIGAIGAKVEELQRRAGEDRDEQSKRHIESQRIASEHQAETQALFRSIEQKVGDFEKKLDNHAREVAGIRAAARAASLNLSRRQLAAGGTLLTAIMMLAVWLIELLGGFFWTWLRAHWH